MTTHFDLMQPVFNDLVAYQPGKTIDEIKRTLGLEHVVKLASNENPLGASEAVKDAIRHHLDQLAAYPEDQAPLLRERLCKKLSVNADQLTFGCGSSEIFDLLIQVFVAPGTELLVCERAFSLYRLLGRAIGGEVVTIADNGWQQDWQAMLNRVTDETRMVIFTNPNNPTGTWTPFNELKQFIEQMPKHVVVIIDEAYCEYMDMPEYDSAVSLIKDHPNLVVSRTFSKAYALAGLRVGYSVSSPEIADILNRLRKPFNVANLGLVAAAAALDDTEHLEKTLENNRRGMAQLMQAFDALNLPVITQSANFLAVEFGPNALQIAEKLLHQGVIVRPLIPYKMPNHLRVSVGTETENAIFIEQLNRLKDLL